MRRPLLVAVLAALASLVAGCKPNLGSAPSLIIKPRFLAVRGTPAEAAENEMVTYDALIVDTNGTVSAPPINWAQCLAPNPPANGNSVSNDCLPGAPGPDGGVFTPDDSVGVPTFTAALPSNACTLFGPEAPPPMKGQPPQRPADPDTTGGFYQPVRATWYDQVAFALERVTCNLANAPTAIATRYAMNYLPNKNPVLADLLFDPAGVPTPLYTAGQTAPPAPATVAANQTVTLQADFSPDSAETFLVWNVVTLTLDTQRESLRVAWFATGGSFDHDVTGHAGGAVATDAGQADAAAETDVPTFTQNVWHAPETPGPVHLWAVLRDNRGGIDFAAAEINVSPP